MEQKKVNVDKLHHPEKYKAVSEELPITIPSKNPGNFTQSLFSSFRPQWKPFDLDCKETNESRTSKGRIWNLPLEKLLHHLLHNQLDKWNEEVRYLLLAR